MKQVIAMLCFFLCFTRFQVAIQMDVGTSSKDKENEKFWEGMFAYKTTCEEDSNMKNLLKENPDWDDDTRKCCTRIYVNNCFEKQYGLKHVLPLEPIIDNRCLNHLRDTQTNCKINTSVFGNMIVGYSICYINSKFRLNQIIKPEEGYLNVMYYENFNVKKRKDKNNATYCCFEKELCECFETNFRPTCTQNLRSIDAKRNNFEYCDCKKIPRDPTINCEVVKCPKFFLKEAFEEKRDNLSFTISIGGMFIVNLFLVKYYCYDSSSQGKRSIQPVIASSRRRTR